MKRYRDLPIHAKLLVPFAILMIVWGGFGAAILAHGTASEARGRATARLSAAFDGARATLSDAERGLLETTRLAANTQGVADALRRRDAKLLRQILEPLALNAGHDRLCVVDRSGAVIFTFDADGDRGQTALTDPAVLGAARGDSDARGDKFATLTSDELLVAGPVKDASGRVIGAVVTSDELAHVAARMGRGTGARVVLFDSTGNQLTANGGPLPFREPDGDGLYVKVRETEDMEALYGPLVVRGERAAVLAVAFPSRILLAGVDGRTTLLALLVGIAVLVALGVGVLTARAITRPLGALVDATRSLASGDLDARASLEAGDEIGSLARSFDAMAAELQASHLELEAKVHERTAELHRANGELTRINVAKSAFLATLSHELRTPLNGIIGFADMLSDPVFGDHPPAETRALAANILVSGQHLLRLINDLLDLAKIEAGKIDIRPEAVDVSRIIAEVDAAMHPMAREHRITMVVDLPEAVPRVVADPARLRQILINLVSNAIKFTPVAGRVAIAAEIAGDDVAITVTDTGPGLRDHEIARIFEPYERGDAARNVEGAGLGLSLARLLAEHMDGRIEVSSILGEGSTFLLRLPAAATSRSRAREATA